METALIYETFVSDVRGKHWESGGGGGAREQNRSEERIIIIYQNISINFGANSTRRCFTEKMKNPKKSQQMQRWKHSLCGKNGKMYL